MASWDLFLFRSNLVLKYRRAERKFRGTKFCGWFDRVMNRLSLLVICQWKAEMRDEMAGALDVCWTSSWYLALQISLFNIFHKVKSIKIKWVKDHNRWKFTTYCNCTYLNQLKFGHLLLAPVWTHQYHPLHLWKKEDCKGGLLLIWTRWIKAA